MKRMGHLIERIADADNLRLAFWKAARAKQAKVEVIRFRRNLQDQVAVLRKGLLEGTTQFGDYHSFRVFDPKERHICAAAFPERVLHHAIMNICEPVLERSAIFHSYACRRGGGQFAALHQARIYSRQFSFYLKLDIRKYFDSIDHEILLTLLERCFKDGALLRLFEKLLQSYATEPRKGLPIGALTSQHFANHYLGLLDRFITENEGVSGCVRYMDDFVIWGNDRERLVVSRARIEQFLGDHLKLSLKRRSPVVKTSTGLPFLGYRVFKWGLLLAPRTKQRFIRRLRAYKLAFESDLLSERELQNRLTAACAVVKHARSWRFRRHVLNEFGGVSMGLEPRGSRRELEQPGREMPLREPEQERSVEPEQQPGFSGGSVPQLSSEQPDGS